MKTVHVEAEWDRRSPVAETRWLASVHAEWELPTAIVGHTALDHAEVAEVLAGHAESPLMRGIRHKPQAAPSRAEARRGAPGSMDDPQWRRGYALLERHGLSFDPADAVVAPQGRRRPRARLSDDADRH